MTYCRVCAASLLAICAVSARAEAFMASFDQAQWRVQRSALVCRLTQAVPRFGEAIFETVNGGRQRFVLQAKQNPLASGAAELTAAAPSWNPTREPVALGTVDIAGGGEPLQLGDEAASHLLASLREGLVPMFERPLQSDAQRNASVALSPVNFLPAYRQYNMCIEHLLPVTFGEVKNTVVQFGPGQSDLNAAARRKIDLLLQYAAADHAITQFEIRSVSNDHPRLLDNFELAKQRAHQVSEYLASHGIQTQAIATAYHGKRAFGRSQERYVAIRLKRSQVAR